MQGPAPIRAADALVTISTAENDNLPVHEDKQRGVYVKNLSEFYVGNSAEVYEVMRQGGSARAVSATSASVCLRLRLSRQR